MVILLNIFNKKTPRVFATPEATSIISSERKISLFGNDIFFYKAIAIYVMLKYVCILSDITKQNRKWTREAPTGCWSWRRRCSTSSPQSRKNIASVFLEQNVALRTTLEVCPRLNVRPSVWLFQLFLPFTKKIFR